MLGGLDGYGKHLFQQSFSKPIFRGESIDFSYDYDRLLRWLLKLCFNSARANNADVTILVKYRQFMLGIERAPGDIAAYAHLVCPTDFSTHPPSAAYRTLGYPDYVAGPQSFRLSQIRPDVTIFSDVVQRQVYIHSFCFTLFVADPDEAQHVDESKVLQAKFFEHTPSALPLPSHGLLTLRSGDVHFLETKTSHVANYPSRFSKEVPSPDDALARGARQLISGDMERIMLLISREEVEEGDIDPTVHSLWELVRTRDIAMASMQRLVLLIHGYDDDSRDLWNIPEAREWVNRVFVECPHITFLVAPGSTTLEAFALCYCRDDGSPEGGLLVDLDKMDKFFELGYGGLNDVTQRHAISIEVNKKLSEHLPLVFTSFLPPQEVMKDHLAFELPNLRCRP